MTASTTPAPESDQHTKRLAAQRLTGLPATSAEAGVEHLLAVQGQDPRGARLALRARTIGLRASDVDAGLTDRRTYRRRLVVCQLKITIG